MAKHMPHKLMRAKGGKAGDPENTVEQEEEFLKASRTAGAKRGGPVHGSKSHGRPDKRARGGATSDMNPETSAGKMSHLPYETKDAANKSSSGSGPDRD